MSYKLLKPYTQEEKNNFIVEYNHNQGLKIEETSIALYALLPNEIMVNNEPTVDTDYEAKEAQKVQVELVEYNYEAKAKKAYGGILINDTYLFETNETSQSMITASLIGLQNAPDETTLNWKVYANNKPIVVPLTKVQLAQLFDFAFNMVTISFKIEGLRNEALAVATVEDLNNEQWVEQYKIATDFAFNQINNKIDVVLVANPTETPSDEPLIEGGIK